LRPSKFGYASKANKAVATSEKTGAGGKMSRFPKIFHAVLPSYVPFYHQPISKKRATRKPSIYSSAALSAVLRNELVTNCQMLGQFRAGSQRPAVSI
jgi:hypothetical protein